MSDVAVNVYTGSVDRIHCLKRHGSLSCSLPNESSCDCPGGCRVIIACLLVYKGNQLPVYGFL
jgi:hypothetical protein